MTTLLTRRRFLQTSAATGAIGFWTGTSPAADKKPGPNDRLQIALVGVAGKGKSNWIAMDAAGAEVVAFADANEAVIGEAKAKFPKAKFTPDFRKLFDLKGIDALVVSTPDHTHFLPSAMALQAGMHVFCEKPLAHSIEEARILAQLAAKHKRVTQMGTQIHAGDNYRRVVELIQAGVIGPVNEVHVWVGTQYYGGDKPTETPPVPAGLHWDLWIGPAPEQPYRSEVVPFWWRRWWDFGGGTLNDMACHYMDLPFWALNLRHPTRVEAEGDPAPAHPHSAPKQLTARYQFPARDGLPPVALTWYDGGRRPPHFAEGKLPKWGNGVLFVGTKGMLIADYGKYQLLPEKAFEGVKPSMAIPSSIGHYKEWVEACKTGGPTTCNFDYSGALTEAVLLGTVSYRTGKPIEWDAAGLKATNAADAERFIRKEYRKGWALS